MAQALGRAPLAGVHRRRARAGSDHRSREIDELEELIDAGLALVGAVIAQPEADVVGDGEVREERVLLEHQPAGRRSGGRWSRPSSTSAPASGSCPVDRHQPGDRTQQRRLAAAARTDQSEKFAGCEFEIDTVDREDVLVGLDDGVEPKRRDGHARSAPRDS